MEEFSEIVVGIIFIPYMIAAYWAVNKVIYEGKTVFYTSLFNLILKKAVMGFFFGAFLIPIAIIKSISQKNNE